MRDPRLDPDDADDWDGRCDCCGAYATLHWFDGDHLCSVCLDVMEEADANRTEAAE